MVFKKTREKTQYNVFLLEHLFPVLDVVRLAAKLEKNNAKICTKNEGFAIEKLKYCISNACKVANNTLVALRALSNLCACKTGQDVIFENKFDILENLTGLGALNKNAQVNTGFCKTFFLFT